MSTTAPVSARSHIALTTTRFGRTLGFLWHVHICEGSAVRRTFLGLTHNQASARANRWLQNNR